MFNNPKTKKILKQIIKWVIYVAFFAFTVNIPNLYWLSKGYGYHGRHAICNPTFEDTFPTKTQIEKIFTDKQPITYADFSGELTYDDSEEAYYVSDGILRIPLNLANCQNLDVFRSKPGMVSIRGAVVIGYSSPIAIVKGMRDSLPTPLHVLYTGASGISIIIFLAAFIWLCRAIRWLLGKIGIRSPEQRKYSEVDLDNSHAGYLLLIGLFSFLFWLWNPYFGMAVQIVAILSWFKSGLRSNKKVIAIIGLILNSITFLIMLIFSIGQFSFTVPNRMNFYEGNQWKNWNNKSSPTISMPLDLNAYTNTKYRFTFHAPNGWTKDESGKDNSIVMFATPETLGKNNKGEPIQARIIATVMTLPSTVTLDQFIDVLNKQNAQEKMFRPVALKTIPIEGGVFTAKTLEFVNDEKGVVSHALTYLIQRGNTNTIYVIGGQAPESKWKDYEPIIHDSLRTFTLY